MTTEQEDSNGKPNGTPLNDDSARLASDNERLQQELNETKDKYVRAHAEMENMRRRFERERSDLLKYALENVMKDFLPALDSLQQAVPDAPSEQVSNDSSYRDGLVMVKKQLLDTFQKHGLEVIKAAGEPFDPNMHQAIQRIDSSDVTVETVGSEFARGYQLHGRLLRPAMVSVLVPA
jgi:molecular chaperone GrpE